MSAVKREPGGGRRGRTTRAEVIAKAVAIADARGVEALTIRALAAACGLSPMGIYRYVRDREELLDLVVEHILEELPSEPTSGTWKEQAVALFGGFRAMALAHPGVTVLGVTRVSPVPAMARFTEQALSIMEQAGLEGQDTVLAYDTLLMFTIGSVLWQLPRRGAERLALLDSAAAAGQPAPHLLKYAAPLGQREPDRYFAFGLDVLLGGLDARMNGSPFSDRSGSP